MAGNESAEAARKEEDFERDHNIGTRNHRSLAVDSGGGGRGVSGDGAFDRSDGP